MDESESENTRPRSRKLRTVLFACLLIMLGCLLLNRLVLGSMPHGWDDSSYYFQGKVFASGRAAAPSTPLIDMFWMTHVINRTDKRFAKYPPGWPALLAPAMAAGAPQLANAMLAGLTALLMWLVARRFFGSAEAWGAVVLAGLSPFYMFMGSNYLSHMATACALTGTLYFATRSFDATVLWRSFLWGLAAGGAAAVACLSRPYTAALGLVGTLAVLAVGVRRSVRSALAALAGAVLSLMLGAGLFFQYNLATTGQAMVTGYQLYDRTHTFLGEGGWARESIWENMQVNLPRIFAGLNQQIWGFAVSDLWLVCLAIALGWRKRIVWGLLAALLIFGVGHSAYFYFDQYFGPRLIFETMPWVLVLSSAGAVQIYRKFTALGPAGKWICAAVGAVFMISSAIFFLGRSAYYRQNYCGQGTEILGESKVAELRSALVLVRTNEPATYANFAFLNDVNLYRGKVVFARYVEGRLPAAMTEFPRETTLILNLEVEPIAGPDSYADRFRIKRLEWERVR